MRSRWEPYGSVLSLARRCCHWQCTDVALGIHHCCGMPSSSCASLHKPVPLDLVDVLRGCWCWLFLQVVDLPFVESGPMPPWSRALCSLGAVSCCYLGCASYDSHGRDVRSGRPAAYASTHHVRSSTGSVQFWRVWHTLVRCVVCLVLYPHGYLYNGMPLSIYGMAEVWRAC